MEPEIVRKLKSQSGFTLLELMVVVVIMALAAALVIPRLPQTEGTKLKDSARNIASVIRFLNDRAAVTKASYRLHLDLTENNLTVAKLSEKGEELPPDDQFLNRKFIDEGITIEDVTSARLGKVTEGGASFLIGSRGMAEPLLVHLKGGTKEFTVIAYPFGGKVEVLEGYQELKTEVGT